MSGERVVDGREQDPGQLKKFGEVRFGFDSVDRVQGIQGPVVRELSNIFGVELSVEPSIEELSALTKAIGPAMTLQDNIDSARSRLGDDAGEVAVRWVERSGLLEAVYRSYENPDKALPQHYEATVETGGVRNWMQRRAALLEGQDPGAFGTVYLVAGNREMAASEGEDVRPGDTEAVYMQREIAEKLRERGFRVVMHAFETKSGNEVAAGVAQLTAGKETLLLCNAGNWVQNGGQINRARGRDGKLYVISDTFPVAKSGEPPAIAQNPLSALGVIARNLHEMRYYL